MNNRYMIFENETTYNKNHLFKVNKNFQFVMFDKMGNVKKPITTNNKYNFYANCNGDFWLLVEPDTNTIFLLQQTKIIRNCTKDKPISQLGYNDITYKNVCYIMNAFQNGKWKFPLIKRLEKEVEKYVLQWI